MVDDVEPASVRVSWQSVENATLSHSHRQRDMIKKDCVVMPFTEPVYQLLPPLPLLLWD